MSDIVGSGTLRPILHEGAIVDSNGGFVTVCGTTLPWSRVSVDGWVNSGYQGVGVITVKKPKPNTDAIRSALATYRPEWRKRLGVVR